MACRCFFAAVALLICCLGKSSGQAGPDLDSLEQACHAYPKEDSVKAKMLIELASNYRNSDPVKGLEAAEEALRISRKVKLPFFIAESQKVKGLNLFNMGQQGAGAEQIEQALALSKPLGNQKQLADIYLSLGKLYFFTYRYDETLKVLQEALSLFERLKDKTNMGSCLIFLGLTKSYLSDNLDALEIFNRAIALYQEIDNVNGLKMCYNNLGILYTNMAEYNLALVQYQKGLVLSEKTNDAGNTARIYTNLAAIHYRLDDVNRSMDYDKKALEIYQKLGEKQSIGLTYINLASKYLKKADYDQSIEYNLKGIQILEPLNAVDNLSIGYSNLGVNYMSKKDFEKALEYTDLAMGNFEKLNNNSEKARMLLNKGMIILDAPDSVLHKIDIAPSTRYDKAEAVFLEGYELSKKTNATVYQLEISRQLSKVYELKADHQKALKSYVDYMVLKDSITGEDIRQQISRKEIQFEFDKKEATLQLESELIRQQLEKQQLLSFQQQQTLDFQEQGLQLASREKELQQLALFQEKSKTREQHNQLLRAEETKQLQTAQLNQLSLEKEVQQQSLDKKNIFIGLLWAVLLAVVLMALSGILWLQQKRTKKDIQAQKQFTQQLFANTEEERSRIARDLHDGINHELLALKRDFLLQSDRSQVTGKIDRVINEIRTISRNLHPVMLESIGLKISLETLCEQLMRSGNLFLSYDFNYHSSLSKYTELQIFRIVQESLTNTLKYAQANAGKITLSEQAGILFLTIKDNGKGFDVGKVMQSGKAFGLNSIIQRSLSIGGTASIHSSASGTVVQVKIPVSIHSPVTHAEPS